MSVLLIKKLKKKKEQPSIRLNCCLRKSKTNEKHLGKDRKPNIQGKRGKKKKTSCQFARHQSFDKQKKKSKKKAIKTTKEQRKCVKKKSKNSPSVRRHCCTAAIPATRCASFSSSFNCASKESIARRFALNKPRALCTNSTVFAFICSASYFT